ncbi:hypothetical protein MMC30_007891 [Trapelia coarctata]|nr:hypothetical protein [Trapelia coarctata]
MRNGLPDPNRGSVVRETNREICTNLRNDWDWPSPNPSRNRIEASTPWRERESSPSSSSEQDSPDPYKYDTPDSVAECREGKKRKRRERFMEEVAWNEGLRTFVERRNVWTGGAFTTTSPIGLLKPENPALAESGEALAPTPAGLGGTTPVSGLPTSRSSAVEIVPLPAPIIPPSNPIRANITSAAYTNIYNKVIVEGITPKIPINLADMTKAITEGWKANGEWPPTVKAPDIVPIARRKKATGKDVGLGQASGSGQDKDGRRSLTMRGVGKMKKVLGFKGDGDGDGASGLAG